MAGTGPGNAGVTVATCKNPSISQNTPTRCDATTNIAATPRSWFANTSRGVARTPGAAMAALTSIRLSKRHLAVRKRHRSALHTPLSHSAGSDAARSLTQGQCSAANTGRRPHGPDPRRQLGPPSRDRRRRQHIHQRRSTPPPRSPATHGTTGSATSPTASPPGAPPAVGTSAPWPAGKRGRPAPRSTQTPPAPRAQAQAPPATTPRPGAARPRRTPTRTRCTERRMAPQPQRHLRLEHGRQPGGVEQLHRLLPPNECLRPNGADGLAQPPVPIEPGPHERHPERAPPGADRLLQPLGIEGVEHELHALRRAAREARQHSVDLMRQQRDDDEIVAGPLIEACRPPERPPARPRP